MSFGAPQWFFALLIVPVLAAIFLRNEAGRDHLLRKLVAARLLGDLVSSSSAARRRWKFVLAMLGLACVILALMQPNVGYIVINDTRSGVDLMIAVDTSKSMLSTDVQPDRLTRAKFAAQDLVDSLPGDRAGLVAFAGTAFVEAPLTIDYSAVENSLTALDTSTIPRGGTNIASAIRAAADAFGEGEGKYRALVLFTDGEELEDDAVEAAKEVNGKFRIFTVGVGTAEGSLIPIPASGGGTDFVKDDQGQYVRSRLDEEKLKEIANATGGFYIHLDNGLATAKAIVEQGLQRMQEHQFQTRETRPIARYEWPLTAGIILLFLAMAIRERRRPPRKRAVRAARPAMAAATALALLFLIPARGWCTNEGLNLYNQKDYKGAYNVFQQQLQHNPNSDGLEFDRGASAYKDGDYDSALQSFGKVLGSRDQTLRGAAEYNLGNTLVQRGALQQQTDEKINEWKQAVAHYDEALKVDPKNADASYNETLVKKMITDLQNQQKQQQQQNQNQEQQQQQQNQQNQQQQNQQQQNQQQQNQQAQNQQQGQQSQQQQNQQAQNQQQQGQQNQQQNGQSQQQNRQAQNQQTGRENQNQPQSSGTDEQNQASATQNHGMSSPTPSPGPGILREQSQKDQQAEAQAAARAATESTQGGQMTPSQAKALIDSQRNEDAQVSFYDRQQNADDTSYKDW
jgi:Ca-activated chloride channel family protein